MPTFISGVEFDTLEENFSLSRVLRHPRMVSQALFPDIPYVPTTSGYIRNTAPKESILALPSQKEARVLYRKDMFEEERSILVDFDSQNLTD